MKNLLLASFTLVSLSLSAQKIKLIDCPSTSSFRGLDMLSDKEWWVSGQKNTVLRTTDAGRTWTTFLVGDTTFHTDFRDIEVIDSKTVYLMGITRPALVYKTVDAGISWRRVFLDKDTSAFLDAIDFYDPNHGVCIADPVGGSWRLLETTDSGETWHWVNQSKSPAAQKDEAAFAGGGQALRTFSKDEIAFVSGGGEQARLIYSKDRGRTWSNQELQMKSGKSYGAFALEKNYKGSMIIVGGDFDQPLVNKENLVTADGGEYQDKLLMLNGTPSGYRCAIKNVEDKTMICTGDMGTDISYDGGLSWKPLSKEGFYSIDCVGRTCVLSGKKGKIGLLKVPAGR